MYYTYDDRSGIIKTITSSLLLSYQMKMMIILSMFFNIASAITCGDIFDNNGVSMDNNLTCSINRDSLEGGLSSYAESFKVVKCLNTGKCHKLTVEYTYDALPFNGFTIHPKASVSMEAVNFDTNTLSSHTIDLKGGGKFSTTYNGITIEVSSDSDVTFIVSTLNNNINIASNNTLIVKGYRSGGDDDGRASVTIDSNTGSIDVNDITMGITQTSNVDIITAKDAIIKYSGMINELTLSKSELIGVGNVNIYTVEGDSTASLGYTYDKVIMSEGTILTYQVKNSKMSYPRYITNLQTSKVATLLGSSVSNYAIDKDTTLSLGEGITKFDVIDVGNHYLRLGEDTKEGRENCTGIFDSVSIKTFKHTCNEYNLTVTDSTIDGVTASTIKATRSELGNVTIHGNITIMDTTVNHFVHTGGYIGLWDSTVSVLDTDQKVNIEGCVTIGSINSSGGFSGRQDYKLIVNDMSCTINSDKTLGDCSYSGTDCNGNSLYNRPVVESSTILVVLSILSGLSVYYDMTWVLFTIPIILILFYFLRYRKYYKTKTE